MPNKSDQSLWTLPFIRLLILILFIYNGVAIVNSTFSVYIVEEFGGSAVDVSLASSAMIITSMLFRPFAGFLIDRLGRRLTIAVSLCVTALISLAYLLPTNIMGLILLRGLMGLPFAMNTAGVATLRTDLIPDDRKVEGFSVTTISIMLSALVIGPNLGFLVLNIRGFSLLFPIAAGLLITAVGNLLLLKFHDIHTATNRFAPKEVFEPRAIWFALLMGILFIGWPGVLTYSPLYSLEVGLSFGGFFFLAFGSGLILSQFIAKIILSETRSKSYTAFAILLVVAGHSIIGLVRNQAGFLLGAVFIGAGYGLSFSIFTKLAFDLVIPERRGRCSGTLFIVEDLGATIGIYAYSFIADATGTFANAYLMAAGISLISLSLLLFVALPDYKKRISGLTPLN
jgi:MFS family permease